MTKRSAAELRQMAAKTRNQARAAYLPEAGKALDEIAAQYEREADGAAAFEEVMGGIPDRQHIMDRLQHESADDARTEAAALRQRAAKAETAAMRGMLTRAAFELDTVAALSDAEDNDGQG
jgi:hypothetical protein